MSTLSDNSILQWRWKIGAVTDGLFVGGDLPSTDDDAVDHLDGWIDAGVTHILDVREEWNDQELVADHAPEVGYTHLGTHDDGGAQADTWFEAGVGAARNAALDPGAGLLVHCHMGINRGPSMAFAVLLDRGWDIVAGLDAIRSARPIAAIAYADDAAAWHLREQGASSSKVEAARKEVRAWHRANDIDLSRVIRQIRRDERAA